MLHHLSFGVSDLARASAFYDAVLGALGYRRVSESDRFVGYGLIDGEDRFALKLREGTAAPGAGCHLAFAAASRAAVAAFYQAGLKHGGRDDGAPGVRAHYGPN